MDVKWSDVSQLVGRRLAVRGAVFFGDALGFAISAKL